MLSAGHTRRRTLLTHKHSLGSGDCRRTFSRVHTVMGRHHPTLCRRRTVRRTLIAKLSFVHVPDATKLMSTLGGGSGGRVTTTGSDLRGTTSHCFTSIPFPRIRHVINGRVLGVCVGCVPTRRHVNVFRVVSGHFGNGDSTFVSTYFRRSVFNGGRGFTGFVHGPDLCGVGAS